MGLAVGEEVVDEHANDGEDEDDEGPEDLVGHRAVGLKDLDCRDTSARGLKRQTVVMVMCPVCLGEVLTPRNNVQHQDDESNDTSTGTCLPWLSSHGRHRRGFCEHGERELEESGDDEVEHDGGLSGVLDELIYSL